MEPGGAHRRLAKHREKTAIGAAYGLSADCAASQCLPIQKVENQTRPVSTNLTGERAGASFSEVLVTIRASVSIHGPPPARSRPIYLTTTRLLI